MGLKNKNTGQGHKKSACNQTGASNSLGQPAQTQS